MENNPRPYQKGHKQEPLRGKIIIGIVAIVVIVAGAVLFFSFRGGDEITGEVIGQEIDEVRVLRIVTSPWKPYMYEVDGENVGLAVDLLDRIMIELDVPYTFELLPWTRALKLAESGEADVPLVATYTSERTKFLYFTPEQASYSVQGGDIPESTFLVGEYVFFIRNILADSLQFESVDKVIEDEYRIGVSQGYIYDFIPYEDPRLITSEFSDHVVGMQALFDGRVDVYAVEKLVGISTMKDLGLENDLTFVELNTDKAFFPLYFPYSKNSDYPNVEQLTEETNRVIVELKRSGEYVEIISKYLK